MNRDGTAIRPDREIKEYGDLVNFLNKLNADWVTAMKRVSPEVLMEWLMQTHEGYVSCLEKLDPNSDAKFSVAWAGEKVSTNWFHIAREYTEKWHHQQQIREAVSKPGILTNEFYKPVLDTFMRALPFRYEKTQAEEGTSVRISVGVPVNNAWTLLRSQQRWVLSDVDGEADQTSVTIPAEVSWKLFTKAVRYEEVKSLIQVEGEEPLALPALQMVTVMA